MTDRRPKWRQVADDLRARINAGDPGPGERLPAETDLARRYGVGRGTLRAALDTLADEGLVTRRPKTGTTVRDRTVIDLPLRRYGAALGIGADAWARTVQAAGLSSQVSGGQDRRETAGQTACLLQVSPETEVTVREWVMLADGMPMQLQRAVYLQRAGVGEDARGVEATEHIGSRRADPQESARLQVPAGAPVMEVRRVTYDQGGRPVGAVVSVCTDRIRLVLDRTPLAPEEP